MALGNPHFSLEEHGLLVELCEGRQKHPDVTVVITSGPEVWGSIHPNPNEPTQQLEIEKNPFFFPTSGDSTKSTFGFPRAIGSFWCPAGERHLLVHVGRGAGRHITICFMNCERVNM